MSKRQRFFVELREGEVTVISWKKLIADAGRVLDVTRVAAAPPKPSVAALTPPLNANVPENLNMAENSLKPRRKLKLEVPSSKAIITVPTFAAAERKWRGSPLEDRSINSSCELKLWEKARKQKANVNMIKAVKDELDEIAKQVAVRGEVHRSISIPCASGRAKISCRTEKKAQACFRCPKKGNQTGGELSNRSATNRSSVL